MTFTGRYPQKCIPYTPSGLWIEMIGVLGGPTELPRWYNSSMIEMRPLRFSQQGITSQWSWGNVVPQFLLTREDIVPTLFLNKKTRIRVQRQSVLSQGTLWKIFI